MLSEQLLYDWAQLNCEIWKGECKFYFTTCA